jgi:hypothetical protein
MSIPPGRHERGGDETKWVQKEFRKREASKNWRKRAGKAQFPVLSSRESPYWCLPFFSSPR